MEAEEQMVTFVCPPLEGKNLLPSQNHNHYFSDSKYVVKSTDGSIRVEPFILALRHIDQSFWVTQGDDLTVNTFTEITEAAVGVLLTYLGREAALLYFAVEGGKQEKWVHLARLGHVIDRIGLWYGELFRDGLALAHTLTQEELLERMHSKLDGARVRVRFDSGQEAFIDAFGNVQNIEG